MKPSHVSRSILFPLLALVVAQFACNLGAQPPSAAPQQPDASLPAPSASVTSAPDNSNAAGQIVISGAVKQTFTPVYSEADIPGGVCVMIFLWESAVDGIYLDFPADTQPGAYPLEGGGCVSSAGNMVGARYDVPGDNAPHYMSTNGTLTLTAVGSKFSGQFQFTAVDSKDASKTISVSGSFTDVPLSP